MIIKEINKSRKAYFLNPYLLSALAILALGYFLYTIKNQRDNENNRAIKRVLFCDAEKTDAQNKFTYNSWSFENGHTRTNKEAFEGKHSSFINLTNRYSFSCEFENYKEGDFMELSAWVKAGHFNNVHLVASSSNVDEFYMQGNDQRGKKNGWQEIILKFIAPAKAKVNKIKLYAYISESDKGNEAYIDNFTLRNLTEEKAEKNLPSIDVKSIDLRFDVKAYAKLLKKRNEALDLGLLIKEDDDWVKGKLKGNDFPETEISARLKGDWTDHLNGEYWSYRIKMPKDKSWNRMMTFSIQHPKTRGYLHEWVFHKMLDYEDVISPRYDLIELSINNKDKRVFAYEEHFEKQIVEYKRRREGVIIAYAEDEFWDFIRRSKTDETAINNASNTTPRMATIEPFKAKKLLKSEALQNQFEEASNLLYGFQQFELDVEEVFDVEQIAKFYAICEIIQAYHAVIWHNTRYYYNPVIRKLEPIGFDGFIESGVYDYHGFAFFGAYKTKSEKEGKRDQATHLFRNKSFNERYCHYLNKFSKSEYLHSFFETIDFELAQRERLLRNDGIDKPYDKKKLFDANKRIQSAIYATNDISIKAYLENSDKQNNHLKITNFHPLPLIITGSSIDGKNINPLAEEVSIYSNRRDSAYDYLDLSVPNTHNYVHYKVAGIDSSYTSKVKKHKAAIATVDSDTDRTEMLIPVSENLYTIKNNIITFNRDSLIIRSPLKIPSGKKLIIEGGTNIDFQNHSFLLSYGSVEFIGSKSNPINIYTSDNSCQGLHILQAEDLSKLDYVNFNNLNTLTNSYWNMTGAVTFYESDVNLNHVNISNNSCEDALNIIRANFNVDYLHISNTFADGFDADFCNGVLKNSYFVNTGNDGIDFSGSEVYINNIKLINIGDKGISAGEEATLNVENVDIDKAVIGIASKDLSKVFGKVVHLKNCNKGFAAYQKKPEFGPATINISNYSASEVEFLQLAEDDSKIELSNEEAND